MAQAAVLTLLTLTDNIQISTVILLALSLGIITAVETPVRQSFTVEMVGREDLRQAIASAFLLVSTDRASGVLVLRPTSRSIFSSTLMKGCFTTRQE